MGMGAAPSRSTPSDVHVDADDAAALRSILHATLDNVDQGIMMIDGAGNVHVANRRAIELLGLPDDLIARRPHFAEIVDFQVAAGEFDSADHAHLRKMAMAGLAASPPVYERKRPNGVVLEIRTAMLPDGGAVRTFTDITERKAREAALSTAEAEYRGLFENTVVGIYRSSIEGRQLRANPALVRLNGYASEAEQLAAVNDIAKEWYVDPNRRDEFVREMQLHGKVTDFVSEIYRHGTRERIWVSETAWLVTRADGTCCFEGTVVDATERKRAEERIAHLALHDPLTDLANRASFLETLHKVLAKAGSRGLVACVDLDHFKDVNDSLGHIVGDDLLVAAARRLEHLVGKRDVVARLGGDEFALIVLEPEDAEAMAALVVEAMRQPFAIGDHRLSVGASVGFARWPDDGDDGATLLRHADLALYAAKQQGRQTWCSFDPAMLAAVRHRRSIEDALRLAYARDEFSLHFQPIVDVLTRRPSSYEALLRWQHPEFGSPSQFVPVAEETGLLIPIGGWALREACRQAAQARQDVTVSVNLSPMQFRQPDLVGAVRAALAASGLEPRRLILEITETVLLSDDVSTLATFEALRADGVRIALDDFGVGHSSLSYLQKFPFDIIKIDRSFIAQAAQVPANAAIVRAIIGLGRELAIDVVAEGVETVEQFHALTGEGCRFLQGYLFARPAPGPEILGKPLIDGPLRAIGDSVRPPARLVPDRSSA